MNVTDIEIRPLTSADASPYRDIRLAALKNKPEAFDSTFERENVQPLTWFRDRLDSAQVFGAFRSTELLGIAGFVGHEGYKAAHKGLLWGMYVRGRPASRGDWSRR